VAGRTVGDPKEPLPRYDWSLDVTTETWSDRELRHGQAELEITPAADVSIGSFYNHFDSKDQLFQAALKNSFDVQGALPDGGQHLAHHHLVDRRRRNGRLLQRPRDRDRAQVTPREILQRTHQPADRRAGSSNDD